MLALLVAAATSQVSPSATPEWQLLSGNAGHPEAVDLGLTYRYGSPPTNPADEGRRLLDNDVPADDWNNVVGFNGGDKSVEFRWPQAQRLGSVRLRMTNPRRPLRIEVAGRDAPSKSWQPLGVIDPERTNSTSDWYELRLDRLRTVREVRLDLRLKEWGFYLNEVQFYGVPAYVRTAATTVKRTGKSLVLASGGAPRASIVVGRNAPDKVRAAAVVLQRTLRAMSDAGFPIVTDERPVAGARILVGTSRLTQALGVSVRQGSYPVAEQSVARRAGDQIVLLGNDGGTYEGTRRAVYLFLQSQGCGWFGPSSRWTVIPKKSAPAVGELNVNVIPIFNWRGIEWPWPKQSFDPVAWGIGGTGVFHAHNFSAIVPKDDETFRKHPEWFAMVDGKRQKSQLSVTNPEVVDRAAQLAREFFRKWPDHATFSLSPDDNGGFDDSPEARALDVNPGGRTLSFANAVARRVRQTNPGKQVIFYAYWFTKPAPTRVRAEPGVNVMMINDTCQAHALDDPSCPTNRDWHTQFAGWKKTGAQMSAYEWYVPAATDRRWQDIPFLPGEVALQDLRFYRDQGVRWVFYESFNNELADRFPLRWPLYYTVARGMENPKLSFRQILDPACQKLFGPAGTSMAEFYAELSRALQASRSHPGNWTPADPRELYPATVQEKLRRLLTQAESQARAKGDQADAAARVREVRDGWVRAERAIRAWK